MAKNRPQQTNSKQNYKRKNLIWCKITSRARENRGERVGKREW